MLLYNGAMWQYTVYLYHIPCQAPGWLKTFGQFLVLGGGGARLVQTWVWPFFVHRLAGARNKKFGVGKHIFWCQISIFWWKVGAENHFCLGSECIFWVSETLMKLLEGFHEVAREAWRWWNQRCVCFYFPPLAPKLAKLLKPIRGYLNRLLFFGPS